MSNKVGKLAYGVPWSTMICRMCQRHSIYCRSSSYRRKKKQEWWEEIGLIQLDIQKQSNQLCLISQVSSLAIFHLWRDKINSLSTTNKSGTRTTKSYLKLNPWSNKMLKRMQRWGTIVKTLVEFTHSKTWVILSRIRWTSHNSINKVTNRFRAAINQWIKTLSLETSITRILFIWIISFYYSFTDTSSYCLRR